jgi:hypothetical protein
MIINVNNINEKITVKIPIIFIQNNVDSFDEILGNIESL